MGRGGGVATVCRGVPTALPTCQVMRHACLPNLMAKGLGGALPQVQLLPEEDWASEPRPLSPTLPSRHLGSRGRGGGLGLSFLP